MDIPRSLEDITPALVTELLTERFPDAQVAELSIEGTLHGTATKALLRPSYIHNAPGPATMWLKSGFEPHSPVMAGNGVYVREARVYKHILPQLPIIVPDSYGWAWNLETREGVLLIEDLTPHGASFNTPETEISADQAADMLTLLATAHGISSAPGWLDRFDWIARVFEEYGQPGTYMASVSSVETIERLLATPRAADFPREIFDPPAIAAAFARIAAWSAQVKHHTILHGDAHVGNTYRLPDGRAGLLDWQSVRRGGWAFDVAYYMCSALRVEERRRSERELLQHYLERLAVAGGPRPGWDDAWADYRTCFARGFVSWLSNSTTLQPEHYNRIVSTRFAHAIVDHGTLKQSRTLH